MPRILTALLIITLLASAAVAVQQFAPAVAYASAWDAGQSPDMFTTWAGLESSDTDWIVRCREAWLARGG